MRPLAELERPTSLDEVRGYDDIKTVLKRMIDNHTTQHMIFSGPPGCGKTSMAYGFAGDYLGKIFGLSNNDNDFAEFNGSNERGIDVARGYFSTWGSKKSTVEKDGVQLKRIILVDEFDNTTVDFQRAARVIIEKNQETCIYIFIVNHEEGIKERAILSRCAHYRFDPLPPEDMVDWFKEKAEKYDVVFENDDIVLDILTHTEYRGDFRIILNDTLQKLIGIDGVVTKDDLPWIYKDSYKSLIDKMIGSGNFRDPFYNKFTKENIDCVSFLRQLLESLEMDKISVPF